MLNYRADKGMLVAHDGRIVARKRPLTSQRHQAAQVSNCLRLPSQGSGAYADHVASWRAYGKTMGTTGELLMLLGLK